MTNERSSHKELSSLIKMRGLELGFSHVGIIRCEDQPDYAALASSRQGYGRFVDNPNSFIAGCFPSQYFPQGKSVICATYGFSDIDFPSELTPFIGRVYLSRSYVPLPDSIAGLRIEAMTQSLENLGMEVYRGSVEFPARLACAKAGIISYGRNNFAYTVEDGSFIVLYVWLVDAELEYDDCAVKNDCPPDCTRCIDACPTKAIVEPCHIDPMKCVLLNNLMPKQNVDPELMGTHIHGCDICQLACPRNHHVLEKPKRKDPFLEELANQFDLEKLLFLDDEYYAQVVRPIMYNYIRDHDLFRRNAAIAMGNSGNPAYIPALQRATELWADNIIGEAAHHAIETLEEKS